ncbi:uncharacterized protein PHACADRAFT_166282 [Phanerochaete carnosa HHB-10118-sp]|uniref:DEK-C domain-containing protein n=1 Tax=Phanerochaete carnosa (strain HHB-10118-sp) TaxID=650164 RepID=K5VH97_PHACS|nr:uncharacterized protein PHACADRAFT_166282 [Phanerochaete carnosa HHB-10118-sp]EKM50603.1 hypothetical protein PHACADRAFT_166282 [Phanerochaete carnosa HHB-10118-sp]
MAEIDIEEVRIATKDIVRQASEDNTLHEITPRQIRQRIEKQLGLNEGSLDAREFKDAVKAVTAEAMEDLENERDSKGNRMEADEEKGEKEPAPSKKRKSDAAVAENRKKSRAEKSEKATRARDQPSSTSTSKSKPKDGLKNPKGQKVVRSASIVPSSDEEGDDKPKLKSSNEVSSPITQEPPTPHARDSEDQDEVPKRKRGKKVDKATTGRKRKAKDVDESPQDAEIKRLKSFVTACGTRKVWSKEFKDIMDDKSGQIRRLKALLTELGMTGRLSMEKAKAIRAERELAQELEDVRNFEKAVVNGRTRTGQPAKHMDESDEEAENEAVPTKRRAPNARMSIMAFLGDQSDEE